MDVAQLVASWSKDVHTQVGAVIVEPKTRAIVSVGYNGLPRHVNDAPPERSSREGGEKYYWYEHAERNALYNALLTGRSVTDCTMYCTWFSCTACARGIIQSGIEALVYGTYDPNCPRRGEDWRRAHLMLSEAGILMYSLETT